MCDIITVQKKRDTLITVMITTRGLTGSNVRQLNNVVSLDLLDSRRKREFFLLCNPLQMR